MSEEASNTLLYMPKDPTLYEWNVDSLATNNLDIQDSFLHAIDWGLNNSPISEILEETCDNNPSIDILSLDDYNSYPHSSLISNNDMGAFPEYLPNSGCDYLYKVCDNYPRYQFNYGTDACDIYSSPPYYTHENRGHRSGQMYCSDDDSTGYETLIPIKRQGRPRTTSFSKEKQEKRTGKLWEFLRNLLLDAKTCPSLIKWDNYNEGTFKFVQCEKVAQLWGSRKKNNKMNYEKLSRAMRYYYRSEVLLPVSGKRLVYKFGPRATGWKTENPIL